MQDFFLANGYPALFFLSFCASTLIPLGSEWLLVVLLAQGFAPLPVVVVASAGNVLGACTSYFIGIYGSAFLTTTVLRIDPGDRTRAGQLFARYGSWCLLLSWLPVIGDPLCLLAGVMRVGFVRFVVLVTAGKFARYALVAWTTLEGRQLLI